MKPSRPTDTYRRPGLESPPKPGGAEAFGLRQPEFVRIGPSVAVVSVAALAEMFGVGKEAAARMCARLDVPRRRIGGKAYVCVQALEYAVHRWMMPRFMSRGVAMTEELRLYLYDIHGMQWSFLTDEHVRRRLRDLGGKLERAMRADEPSARPPREDPRRPGFGSHSLDRG